MANIVDSAAKAGNLTRLLQALEVTELIETLKNPGPFTVFAPTDEAFEKLSEETRDALQDPIKLKRIIAHHIAFGDVRKEDLLQTDEVTTFENSVIAVDASSEGIKLNNANVVAPEIVVDNGVIYLIDQVLFPALVLSE
ncbi:fasciclin domain-containing protein [Gloeothece verrucosa]|uniref:Beta-Ig-H3/fasciclin n=1 Tax=Gloeothece verrucosa (strain PCC 7822) TaxID=497965 RepID=E0U5K2_GLOV7|nr:fasciclin domain-containing protein [Gloeothece verrucosa]ADN14715.1 beta-Ig-H3/fasciclin [Gloeothece verrucosa PCC 7822]